MLLRLWYLIYVTVCLYNVDIQPSQYMYVEYESQKSGQSNSTCKVSNFKVRLLQEDL